MELLHPRRAYNRANPDEIYNHEAVEMMSVYSGKANSKNDSGIWSNHPDNSYTAKHDYMAVPEYGHDYHLRAPEQDHMPLIQPSARAKWFSGWRTGAYSGACLALTSLIINIAAAAYLQHHHNAGSNLVEVYNGDCDRVSQMDVWVHLLINAISTLLLGGSNYCMQCLCAPTRQDIDKAHARGEYLDIGVPSYRNLSSIAWTRRLMWWILGLSSIPLHLMYNSAFYSSLSSNDYYFFIVTPDFLQGGNATYDMNSAGGGVAYEGASVTAAELQEQISSNTTHRFERLEPLACIQQYSQVFLAHRRNLVIVSSNSSTTDTSVLSGRLYSFANSVAPETGSYRPFDWICTSDPDIKQKVTLPFDDRDGTTPPCDTYVDRIESVADQWSPYGFLVEYCLAEYTEEQCSFNGNIPIVTVVIIANAVKAIIMLIVAYRLTGHPLITVGDAIESFLDTPDETTKGLCSLTRDQAALYALVNPYRMIREGQGKWYGVEKIDSKYRVRRLDRVLRWSSAASGRRWTLTIGFIVGALLLVSAFLGVAIGAVTSNNANIKELGFGTVHASAVISGWSIASIADPSTQIIAAIFIANLPQAILSFLYLNLNGLLTTMWVAWEWSTFAKERKYLRVSTPKARQRSTHFLQLPYKVAIPLMTISGLLHWLVSQSIFLAVVAEYGAQDGDLISPVQVASCGFSPMAMIIVLIVGVVLIVASVIIGRWKYDSSMPLASSCSAAIAAACHRPDWDTDAGISAVQWGVVPGSDDRTGIGHCCFTSGIVEPVQNGKQYGRREDEKQNSPSPTQSHQQPLTTDPKV